MKSTFFQVQKTYTPQISRAWHKNWTRRTKKRLGFESQILDNSTKKEKPDFESQKLDNSTKDFRRINTKLDVRTKYIFIKSAVVTP
jgi:hypothetical protein